MATREMESAGAPGARQRYFCGAKFGLAGGYFWCRSRAGGRRRRDWPAAALTCIQIADCRGRRKSPGTLPPFLLLSRARSDRTDAVCGGSSRMLFKPARRSSSIAVVGIESSLDSRSCCFRFQLVGQPARRQVGVAAPRLAEPQSSSGASFSCSFPYCTAPAAGRGQVFYGLQYGSSFSSPSSDSRGKNPVRQAGQGSAPRLVLTRGFPTFASSQVVVRCMFWHLLKHSGTTSPQVPCFRASSGACGCWAVGRSPGAWNGRPERPTAPF